MKPCKHLDYNESNHPSCTLKIIESYRFNDIDIKYFDRFEGGLISKEELSKCPYTPTKVQFCTKWGRINGIFQCYNENELSCYEGG